MPARSVSAMYWRWRGSRRGDRRTRCTPAVHGLGANSGASTTSKGTSQETFEARAVARRQIRSGVTGKGKCAMSPSVRVSAQASRDSCMGMSPVVTTAGRPSRHCSRAGVVTAGAIHTPAPAATNGWGSASKVAANCAASTGSAPSTSASSLRPPRSARGAHSATSIHAPRAETT